MSYVGSFSIKGEFNGSNNRFIGTNASISNISATSGLFSNIQVTNLDVTNTSAQYSNSIIYATGGSYTWDVPTGTYRIFTKLWGNGGNGASQDFAIPGAGGGGAYVSAERLVLSITSLGVKVGTELDPNTILNISNPTLSNWSLTANGGANGDINGDGGAGGSISSVPGDCFANAGSAGASGGGSGGNPGFPPGSGGTIGTNGIAPGGGGGSAVPLMLLGDGPGIGAEGRVEIYW